MKTYEHAFGCMKKGKCHENFSCPCWIEMTETNIKTGEERITKNCLFHLLPNIMIEVIKASNRPAAVTESIRNEMVKGLDKGFKGIGLILEKGLPELSLSKTKQIKIKI